MTVEVDSYCYTLVFSTNITSLNFDGGYNLYSNITGEEEYLKEYISSRIGLKIALLNQGCVITAEAMSYLNSKGIIKKQYLVRSTSNCRMVYQLMLRSILNLLIYHH